MEIEQRQDVASKQTNTTAETGIPTASGSSAPEVSQSSTISEAITISSQIPDGENKCSSPTRIAAESRLATVLAKCDVSSSSAVITTPQRIHGSSDAINTPGISQTSNTGASTTNSAAAISSKGRVSGGAAAGVAIAMLLVGALIAGAVFFFLLRHQKKRQPPTSTAYQTLHPPYDAATALPEKGPTATGAFATSIDDMLPQPAADDTITDAALKIRDNVKNHVRTHYHSAPVSVAGINQVGLQELATATGVSSSILAGALSNPSTRQDALRLSIGWIMLARCTEERDPSLLPAELSRLAISIPERDPAGLAMYSRWKTVTGALLQQRFGHNVQSPSRDQTSAETTAYLEAVVAPLLQGSVDGGPRVKNLDMILTRSANFAFLLFSQPGSFRFDFSNMHGGLVVFPALVQTIGDQGQVLRPVRVLLEKELTA